MRRVTGTFFRRKEKERRERSFPGGSTIFHGLPREEPVNLNETDYTCIYVLVLPRFRSFKNILARFPSTQLDISLPRAIPF